MQEMIVDNIDDEAAYLLQRAREEQEQAKAATHPKATAAHSSLAERYATRTLMAQIDADDEALERRGS